MLWTNDLKGSIAFYQMVLGFELTELNEDWGWCHMHKDAVNIMFSLPNEHTVYEGEPKFTGSFYLYTDEVDELWEQLRSTTKIAYEINNFEHGMREFAIYDINGYMLQFGRELKEGETFETAE